MINTRMIVSVLWAVLLGSSALHAQGEASPAEEIAILRVAAEYAFLEWFNEQGRGDVVIDPVIQEHPSAKGRNWDGGVLRSIAAIYGARVAGLGEFLTCDVSAPGGPCFVRGADALVTFGAPHLHGEEGTITVRVISRADGFGDPDQAFTARQTLKIAKVDGRWTMLGVESTWVNE